MIIKSRACNLFPGGNAAHSNVGNATSPGLYLWLLVALCAVALLTPVSTAFAQTTTSGAPCKPGYIQRTPGGKCLISLGLANAKCQGRHGHRLLEIAKTASGYKCRFCKYGDTAKGGKCVPLPRITVPYVPKLKSWEQPCKSRGKSESEIERIKRCVKENADPNLKPPPNERNRNDRGVAVDGHQRSQEGRPWRYVYKPEGNLPDDLSQRKWFEPKTRDIRDEQWIRHNVVLPFLGLCRKKYPDRCRGIIDRVGSGGYKFKLCKPGFIVRGAPPRDPLRNASPCVSERSLRPAARAKCKAKHGELGWIIRRPARIRPTHDTPLYGCKKCPSGSMARVSSPKCVSKEIVKVEASVKCQEIYGDRCIGVFPTLTGFTYRFCKPGFIPHGPFRICVPKDGVVVVEVPVKNTLPVKKTNKPVVVVPTQPSESILQGTLSFNVTNSGGSWLGRPTKMSGSVKITITGSDALAEISYKTNDLSLNRIAIGRGSISGYLTRGGKLVVAGRIPYQVTDMAGCEAGTVNDRLHCRGVIAVWLRGRRVGDHFQVKWQFDRRHNGTSRGQPMGAITLVPEKFAKFDEDVQKRISKFKSDIAKGHKLFQDALKRYFK